MTSFLRSVPIAALALWLLGTSVQRAPAQPLAAAPPQSADSATETTLHLHGTVVDGISGKPIPRALVMSVDRRLASFTNAAGVFSLEVTSAQPGGLPLGGNNGDGLRLYVTAQKPGYLAPDNRLSVAFSHADAELQIRLMPTAVIAGHVFGGTGMAPRNVNITLLRHGVTNGERIWAPVGVQRTNGEGSFRFGDLRPGEYTVLSAEWRGDKPLPRERDVISEQYPPVFLGDVPTLDASTRLHMHYGEVAQADLRLHPATYFPVTIPVGTGAPVGLNVRVDTTDAFSGFQLGFNSVDHAVEGALPSGAYTVNLFSFRPEQAYGSVVLHVADAPVRSAPVTLTPAANLSVRLHRQFTGTHQPEHQDVRIFLQPRQSYAAFVTGNTQPTQPDEITLPAVAPGRYSVRVDTSYGYAASVRSGGVDLEAEGLTVNLGSGAAPIEVDLRDDSAQIQGAVATGSTGNSAAPPQAIFACLVPTGPGGQFTTAGIGSDGRFTLGNVVPGAYRLFASSRPPWAFAWRDPESQHLLADKGVAVTVTPGASLQMDAPLLDDATLEMP